MRKILSLILGLLWALPAFAELPTGYTELEYIEGTGTQYITTDITANQDTSAEIKFVPTSVYPSNAVFGARTSKTSDAFNVWLPGVDGGIVSNLGTLGAVTTNTEPILNEVYVMYLSKTRFAVNNLVTNISNVTDFVTPGGIQIFNIYGGAATVSASATSTNRIASGKVYYFKIWQNNTLTHNFIPAKNASGVVGMYDTVGNRFYTNAGDGEFVAGPDACNGTIVNYTSATGTGVQNGTPTPENPIEPTFYKQGNMILRKVGDYADSYDATTGKITRRVGVKVFDGTEDWRSSGSYTGSCYLASITNSASDKLIYNTHFIGHAGTSGYSVGMSIINNNALSVWKSADTTPTTLKQYLAQQYAAGTPVTVWYPLRTETTEDWAATQCLQNIRVATTKYNETAFSPLNTALQQAISVVDSVVSNTITQAASIATLQAQKQTRPNDIADDNEKCPAGKKCLLVEDTSGIPHWYEIVENAWDLPVGYTQLQYIESTGTQYIDTEIIATNWDWSVEFEMSVPQAGDMFFGAGRGLWGSTEWGAQFGLANSSGNANWGFGSGGMNVVISNLGVRTNTFYNYKITKEGLYINGELKSQNTATESFSNSDLSLWICKTNNPGTSGYNKAGSSWKYVRIYNADTALVFNGVPAKNPDGKIGMYDKVSGAFFENKGTGDFIAGPVAQ